jgi:hypothetical protein
MLLGGCLPGGEEGSRCAGYLGCSAGQMILPVDGGSDAPPPPLPPIGTGCGKPLPSDQPMTVPGTIAGYKHYTVMGTGATLAGPQPAKVGPRSFWVRVPADYDPSHPYRVVYLAQGYGPFNMANTATYHLFEEAMGGTEEAIYVALDIPTDMVNEDGYDNRDGPASQEWEAFELFQTVVDQTYCVDNDRVDVVGYDTGAILANQWGCYFAGDGTKPAGDPANRRVFAPQYHIRAQAAVESVEPPNNPPCNGPIAGIWIQDTMGFAPIEGANNGRDRVLTMNGCTGSPTVPWHPERPDFAGCLEYAACPQGYPVVFCTTMMFGGSAQADRAIPAFTLFFNELETRADAGVTD